MACIDYILGEQKKTGSTRYPRWNEIDLGTADTSGHHGLYRIHIGRTEQDWFDSLTKNKTSAKLVRYLMAGGGALLAISLGLICVFLCMVDKKVFAIVAAVVNFMGVATHVAAIALFYSKFDEANDGISLGSGFYLAITAAALALIAVILKLVAAISGGAKVDTFPNKRAYPPPTTRVSYNAKASSRRR